MNNNENKVLQSLVGFVGEDERNVKIQELSMVRAEIKGKDPEEKEYMLLYIAADPDTKEDIKSWEKIKGRTAIREFVKNMIETLDIHESIILVEKIPFDKALSVYDFFKIMEQYYDDNFDIEEYNIV